MVIRVARALLGIACLAMAACSSSGGGGSSSPPAGAAPAGPLSGICPDPLVIQTSWYPEPEESIGYQLVGPNGKWDTSHGYYYGNVGGVIVQVRAGGPFLGNIANIAALYLHPDIFIAEANTDDQWINEAEHPTVAVFAPLQKSPQGILWDPTQYQFTSLRQVGQSGATILKAGEDSAADLLITNGTLNKPQFDFSYDGSPGRFIAAHGKDVLMDYASEDVYNYQHEFTQWGKRLDYMLLADAGYTSYENSFVVTPKALQERSACLQKVVPMLQRAEVDLIKNPRPLSATLIPYSQALKSPTTLTDGLMAADYNFMESNGLLGNGADGTVGSFDLNRVQRFIENLGPVAKLRNIQTKTGLKASDMVTNRFIDPSIHAG